MSSGQDNPFDDIASDLDDIKTSVDELREERPAGVKPDTLSKMDAVLEQASDLADELETQAIDTQKTDRTDR